MVAPADNLALHHNPMRAAAQIALILHAFRYNAHVKGVRQMGYRGNNRTVSGRLLNPGNEGLVDLQRLAGRSRRYWSDE